jgi:hypothetical protein
MFVFPFFYNAIFRNALVIEFCWTLVTSRNSVPEGLVHTVLHHTYGTLDALGATCPRFTVPVASTLVVKWHGACSVARSNHNGGGLGGLVWGLRGHLNCSLEYRC